VQFPELLLQECRCRDIDVIFFGYDSFYSVLDANVDILYDLLEIACSKPETLTPRHFGRKAHFNYSKLVVVAHSLGAVVARSALLKAHDKDVKWKRDIDLLFFAPAHGGARLDRFVLETLTGFSWTIPGTGFRIPIGGLVEKPIRYLSPVLDDLEQGSDKLTKLRVRTEQAFSAGFDNIKARRVVFGSRERVVYTDEFVEDEKPVYYPNRTHLNVCKPTADWRRPVTDLIKLLCDKKK
jgi:pimeloyl-ACP methyl ester carboxylesterase